MYDFNQIIERKNTDSIKYDFALKRGKSEGMMPLWVADMDFRAPEAVINALKHKSEHGIFGYSDAREDYFAALHGWFSKRFGWEIKPEWLIKTPGVVFAICAAIRALTKEGDAVLIQQPVYYPFAESILTNGRKLVINRLVYEYGKYAIDFEDFERKIVDKDVKLFILCNPHNPVGRVWTKEELSKLGDICIRHGVLVVSDEIHQDFVYPGHRHFVFSSLSHKYAEHSVTCTAPTKTFNLAGLQISNIFVQNKEIRHKIEREIVKSGYSQPNVMGLIACKAAYEKGGEWLEEVKSYLVCNLCFVRTYLQQHLPMIRLVEPEGTYLVWLDMSALGLSDKKLADLVEKRARLWLDAGTMFGEGGEGFYRINIATPRPILEQAFGQLRDAIHP